jgi:secondary thiamine-phosphate synthase enzyme
MIIIDMTIVHSDTISITTRGFGDTTDITTDVTRIAEAAKVRNGMLTVFCQGSTGTITTIEFEPGVIKDLQEALEKIVPSSVTYEHDKAWGDGNGLSHVRAALMKPSLTVPVVEGEMTLGTWQQIVFIDFDNRPRKRKIIVQVVGIR